MRSGRAGKAETRVAAGRTGPSKRGGPSSSATVRDEKCPICGLAGRAAYQPFCSVRCADVDLGQWLTGGYAVPVAPDEEEEPGMPGEAPSILAGQGRSQ